MQSNRTVFITLMETISRILPSTEKDKVIRDVQFIAAEVFLFHHLPIGIHSLMLKPVAVKSNSLPAEMMSETGDTDVDIKSTHLSGLKIILGICGGIAAVDSVRILRELRRHSCEVVVIMTHSAQQIISPLAIEWASRGPVILDWESDMTQLDTFDAVLLSPATRHSISSFVHGLLDTPLQMALSAARGRGKPIMVIPSMHGTLSADPVTDELCSQLIGHGCNILWGSEEEGRRKTPEPELIVSEFSHFVNSRLDNRKHVAITLGATKSMLDDIRFFANTSSGKTGWAIAETLYREGHEVTVIEGATTVQPSIPLSSLKVECVDEMLASCLALATSAEPPDAWVHCAAVLDYSVGEREAGKKKSGFEKWTISLRPTPKHIESLSKHTSDKLRIGFKLESEIDDESLIKNAEATISKYNLDFCFANLLSEVDDSQRRGIWLDGDGNQTSIGDLAHLTTVIADVVTSSTND